MKNLPQVTIYTDGSSDPKDRSGGWAAILRYGENEKAISGGARETTNNRMELEAAIQGLKALRRPCRVEIVTDSNYLAQGWSEWLPGWKRNGWRSSGGGTVKNQDLWQALDEAAAPHDVEITWVKGHNGHPENERCDQLANAARQAMLAAEPAISE